MKYAAFAIAAAALAASLSQASAEPRQPAAALVPAAEAVRVQAVAAPSIVEGRQAAVALSAAESVIVARNVSHR